MKLGATLYIKNSLEAVALYQKAFGLELGYRETHPDGTYLHAELEQDGEEILSVSESANDAFVAAMLSTKPFPTMSYGIDLETEEDVRRAYELLADGGSVLTPLGALPWNPCCANVVDRYGVFWYIYQSQPTASKTEP